MSVMADAILYGSTLRSSLSSVNNYLGIIYLYSVSVYICSPALNKQTTTAPPPVSEMYSNINSLFINPLHSINYLMLEYTKKNAFIFPDQIFPQQIILHSNLH